MTKRYEEFIRGPISEMLADLSGRREIKGVCTLVLSGKNKDIPLSVESLESSISGYLAHPTESPGDLARKIALKFGISRKTAYQMILSEKAKEGQ
jgi:16S rRNA (cytidine1402-2'-O)-methyltransferase